MIRECCVCRRIENDGHWIRNYLAVAHQLVSHVYCPSCFEGFMERLDGLSRRKASKEVYTVVEAGRL